MEGLHATTISPFEEISDSRWAAKPGFMLEACPTMDAAVTALLAVLGGLACIVVAGLLIWLAWPLRYPLATESDYTHRRSPWWQIYYGHKYLRPVRRAEKGSGLEEHFADQDFTFLLKPLSGSRKIRIVATGDLMFRRDLLGAGGAKLWDDVGEVIFCADLSIANMEFAVNERNVIEKILQFSIAPALADPLMGDSRFGRFDVMSLANNHINDSLSEGIVSTINYLDTIGMNYVGASLTPRDQEEVRIVERSGIKIAVLGYTFSTNGILLEDGFEHGTNVIRFNALDEADYDPSLIHRHIARARELGAELIVSCHHWGIDLEHYPPARLARRARALLEAGIDVIVGHHPHVVGPSERHTTRDGRDCLIFYSLGNFTGRGLFFPIQHLSQLVEITVESGFDDGGRRVVRPCHVALTPLYHAMQQTPEGVVNRVFPLQGALDSIAAKRPQSFLTRADIRRLPVLGRAYERFRLRGVEYR